MAFHNNGVDRLPGVIVMTVSSGMAVSSVSEPSSSGRVAPASAAVPQDRSLTVLLNAQPEEVSVTLPEGVVGSRMHPCLEGHSHVEGVAVLEGGVVLLPPRTFCVLCEES